MKSVIIFFILFIYATQVSAQKFINRWQQVYGGSGRDVLSAIQPTKDGGFIVSGYSGSDASSTKTQNANNKSNDFWVVKINSKGVVQWNKTIGGNGDELNTSVLATKDGGYLLGGSSVSNISVNKTTDTRDSSYDLWVVKLDSAGNILWNKTFGGIAEESMHSLAEGKNYYMIAGSSYSDSSYEKKQNNFGSITWADYWVIKLTTSGQVIWSQTYGGSNQDLQWGFQICNDGGFYTAGYSYSPNGTKGKKTTDPLGNNDYYVVKSDSLGSQLWDASYGGTFSDYLTDVKQTTDAGFVLGGYSNSPASGNKTSQFLGETDYWLVKTDKTGALKWNKTYGGTKSDFLVSVQQTSDKGYLLGGYSNTGINGTKTEASRGGFDYWIVKTDSAGAVQWNKTIGGSGDDTFAVVMEVSPGEYLAGGTSASPKSGDKKVAAIGKKGNSDYWLVRFGVTASAGKETDDNLAGNTALQSVKAGSSETITRLQLSLSPNPASNELNIFYTNGAKTDNRITLLSNDGKVLEQRISRNASGTVLINVINYKAGIYYVSLSTGNKTVVKKFIKK